MGEEMKIRIVRRMRLTRDRTRLSVLLAISKGESDLPDIYCLTDKGCPAGCFSRYGFPTVRYKGGGSCVRCSILRVEDKSREKRRDGLKEEIKALESRRRVEEMEDAKVEDWFDGIE